MPSAYAGCVATLSERLRRLAIKATVEALDSALEGDELPTPIDHHKSIVSSLEDD